MIINMPSIHGKEGLKPTIIVVHAIAEFIRLKDCDVYSPRFLRSRGESAHAFITPSGETIRTRRDNQIAWHARAQGHNFKSLGIEFMVPGAHTWDTFREAIKGDWVRGRQYDAGVELALDWIENNPIKEIVQHSIIDPENKADPGEGFPWYNFLHDVGI
jgi:N-acetyl-anhydromuramyl-L-alanine amidase AmpD